MDTQVVFQVIVVDKLGVAVEAHVRALTCMLPHVDLEFVLSEKNSKTTCFHTECLGRKLKHELQHLFPLLDLVEYK